MKKWSLIVFVVAVVNFVAFLIGAAKLGGDAVNGKIQDGRYYVADHGKLTEVSHAAFNYSRIHCYSIFVTHPLALFFGLMYFTQIRQRKESPVR
ncbi:MAG TPA: hypothetical protein VK961_17430 [Chthoniobacter sp.]|nr:hypothetical protein [Chthoniobacter sp.]